MTAVWMHARSQWRTRVASLVALAVLIAIGSAVTLTALAAARRTASTVDRFIAHDRTADVIIDSSNVPPATLDRIAHLPGVAQSAVFGPVAAFPAGATDYMPFMTGPNTGAGFTMMRGKLLEGQRADPQVADEVMLSEAHAHALGKHAGDTVLLQAFTPEEVQRCLSVDDSPASCDAVFAHPGGARLPVRVAGVLRTGPDLRNRAGEISISFLTPAFYRAHPDLVVPSVVAVHLHDRARTKAFVAAAQRLMPADGRASFQPMDTSAVEDATSVLAIALLAFGLVAGLAATVAVGQAVLRHTAADTADHATLRAIGASRRTRVLDSVLTLSPAIGAGLLGGLLAAYVASGFMPIGIARRAETSTGRQFDGWVLGVSAVAVGAAIVGLTALASWMLDRRAIATAPRRRSAGARVPLGDHVPRAVGLRWALATGQGWPARTAIVATATAIAGVVGVLGFGASLQHLVATPALYGWAFDAVGVDVSHVDAVRHDPDVMSVVEATAQLALRVDGHPVLGFALRPVSGTAHFPIVRGREPRAADEVALGAKTMRHGGVHIGDTVHVAGPEGDADMRVVGQAVFLTDQDSFPLADGAMVHPAVVDHLGLGDGFQTLAVGLRSGREASASARLSALNGEPLSRPAPPAEVEKLERVERLPQYLAGFLISLGIIAIVHALIVGVRRRRRDFGVLRALGFRPRDVGASVSWQAVAIALLGSVVGLFLGVLLARFMWARVAGSIGVRAVPRLPIAALVLTLPLAVLIAVVASLVPAGRAARLRTADILRSE